MTTQHLSPDLLEMQSAWIAGISSHRAGYPQESNPYGYFERVTRTQLVRDTELLRWAFDLGWREFAHLAAAKKGRAS